MLAAAALALSSACIGGPAVLDHVIRGGWVVDGMGNPAYKADIGIDRGSIVQIGRIEATGVREWNASGKIVCPGFIDVHTHSESIVRIPEAENFVRMGLTTIVTGNCGGSAEDVGKFLSDVESAKISLNVASLVGHNTVRRAAMGGNFNRDPSTAEMAKMRSLVDAAMRDGAVGLSTGLIYLPGTYSKTPEIVELAKVAASYGGIYASHMRSEGLKIFEAIDEVLAVARGAHIRAQISHVKLSGNASWGQADKVLAKIEVARSEGVEITQDQYVYPASSTTISQLVPDWALEGSREDVLKRLDDPAARARIVADMKENLRRNARADFGYAVIANYSKDRSFNGKRIPEAAKIRSGSDDLDAQIDFVLEIERNGGASGVFHGMSLEDVDRFVRHPNTMFASDGGPKQLDETVPHPRSYGNNARVLAWCVRELKAIRLEDAIRKMTSLPAQSFRMRDRGLIREGMVADVLVIDPMAVKDNATYDRPHQFATGFSLVMVNGIAVVENDVHTHARPGRSLRMKGGVVAR